MKKSKKQPNLADDFPKDPPGYNRFVDTDFRFMTITPAPDKNEWNGSWKIKRSKESAEHQYLAQGPPLTGCLRAAGLMN
jgi:hypothetical protein